MSKRKPLTRDQQQDAARLLAAWNAFRADEKAAGRVPPSREAVSNELGWSGSVLGQYLRGDIALNLTALLKICRKIGADAGQVSPDLVKSAEITVYPPTVTVSRSAKIDRVCEPALSYANVEEGPETKGLVPVISWVQAGEWQEAVDNMQPYETEEDPLPCPVPHGVRTYALRVRGDSMTAPSGRSYPDGCLIFVDPDQRGGVVPGNRVIAKVNGEDMVTFKQLAHDGARPYLKPLNPTHPPIFAEFRVLGKVIGMWMPE